MISLLDLLYIIPLDKQIEIYDITTDKYILDSKDGSSVYSVVQFNEYKDLSKYKVNLLNSDKDIIKVGVKLDF